MSIGASVSPQHGTTRTELLKHADIALYAAKAAGRGNLKIFEPRMRADAERRVAMLGLARDALRNDGIVPYYQPKVDLRSGRLQGFEALLRWKHPRTGVQAADSIAAAFQDGELAAEISDRMIERVIADLQIWTDGGLAFEHVAINAAAAEFKNASFAERLLERLHHAGLPTSILQLEVTETVFLGRGAEHVQEALKTLSTSGVAIALDDFGTGYASLSHLKDFPVDIIKIDQSFISKLETDEHDSAIVRAVIRLGRSLGIKIVAEGIETPMQAEFLRRNRCHVGQGYLFGPAEPASVAQARAAHWITTPIAA
jgi:EAL domain-containing protein (putative c-di-GMP-specific phosphodiesterase class I)